MFAINKDRIILKIIKSLVLQFQIIFRGVDGDDLREEGWVTSKANGLWGGVPCCFYVIQNLCFPEDTDMTN